MIKKYFVENLAPEHRDNKEIHTQFYVNTRDYPLLHSHEDYWEFSVVMDGTIDNRINGEIRTYPAGTLFYCTTRDVHCITAYDKKPIRYVNFTVDENTVTQMMQAFSPKIQSRLLKNKRNFALPSEMRYDIDKLLHKLNLLQQKQYAVANDLILAQIMTFVRYIVEQSYTENVKDEPTWLQELNKLKQQESFITYTVDDLCRELNYSRVQLNRLFKAKFGVTPHEYLLSNKLLYAHNLLSSTDMNTLDIANAIGYANLAQFNVVFKERFGVTPGQYRK